MQEVSGEFDRRLEPEMRRFLQGFVKRGLQRAAQVAPGLPLGVGRERDDIGGQNRQPLFYFAHQIGVRCAAALDSPKQDAIRLRPR